MNELIIIVGMNTNGCIGKENTIPWYSKLDLTFFKNTTINNTVIMGRKTFESIGGRPLIKRINYVVTGDMNKTRLQPVQEGSTQLYYVNSIDEALNHFACTEKVFIIGGERIYTDAIQRADLTEVIISIIDNQIEGDTYFPIWLLDKEFKVYTKREFHDENDPLILIEKLRK